MPEPEGCREQPHRHGYACVKQSRPFSAMEGREARRAPSQSRRQSECEVMVTFAQFHGSRNTCTPRRILSRDKVIMRPSGHVLGVARRGLHQFPAPPLVRGGQTRRMHHSVKRATMRQGAGMPLHAWQSGTCATFSTPLPTPLSLLSASIRQPQLPATSLPALNFQARKKCLIRGYNCMAPFHTQLRLFCPHAALKNERSNGVGMKTNGVGDASRQAA
eukprot:352825-Chlamydomonas_euryale.AAC.10